VWDGLKAVTTIFQLAKFSSTDNNSVTSKEDGIFQSKDTYEAGGIYALLGCYAA
jgi:hypothetical protein